MKFYLLLAIFSASLTGCSVVSSAMKGMGDGLVAASQKPIQPIPQPVTCRTQYINNVAYTYCQ